MRYSCIILFLMCFSGTVFAQEKIDSLRLRFRAEQNDSVKCAIINEMLPIMRTSGALDSAFHYGYLMRTLAKSSGNTYYEIRAYVANGLTYAKLDLTDSVIVNYQHAVARCRPGVDDFFKASVLNSLGVTFQSIDLYDSAFVNYLKTIALLEALDKPTYVARTKNNIGNVFWLRNDHKKAFAYYKEALAAERQLNDTSGMPYALTNIANSYNEFGETDSALLAMNEAIAIYRNTKNKKGEAIALGDITFIYNDKGDYAKALVAARRSLALNKETGSTQSMAHSYMSIGVIHMHEKNYDEAIDAFKQGLEITDRLNLKSIAFNIHKHLITVYKARQNYREALKHSEIMVALNDSIFSRDKSDLIAKYETKYESEKKTRELTVLYKNNELQESELRRKTLQQNALIGSGVLIIIASVVAFRGYRSKQEQKRKLLDQQIIYERMEAERLQELDEARARFFVNIAHEFRTPLTLIQVPAELIQQESIEHDSKENAQLILNNASRLLSLTNQLLDLTKLEAGMIKLQPVKRDFIAFAKGCLYSFESLAEEKDITLLFESDEDQLDVDFDPEKCAIILNNLISNALKFTAPFGSVAIQIRSNTPTPALISVAVCDTGIGIDEKSLPKIFDRFYQVGDPQAYNGGTGIGLAFAKELVELHGGVIEVSSTPGKGTTFGFSLPMIQMNTAEALAERVNESVSTLNTDDSDALVISHPSMPDQTRHAYTVLIVEDNTEVRNFIAGMLRQYYHILAAPHGRAGITAATEQIPDLIISDVMMPEMDGFEFCSEIKKDPRTSHIPVILLTAKAGIENKVEGLELGADDFLSKPFHSKELLARITNLIRIRKQLQLKYNLSGDPVVHAVRENKFIKQLKEITALHVESADFSVDDLAREMGMSRTQIHRKLKALTGKSTTQFVREYKLAEALAMLETGEHNVSEVAFKLGFTSLAYFSTAFAQHYGYVPSQVNKKRIDPGYVAGINPMN